MYQENMFPGLVPKNANSVATVSLTATGITASFICTRPGKINRIGAVVSTAVLAGTTAPVVTTHVRPTIGSSTGQVNLATITLPSGTAISSVVYKDITPQLVIAGQEIAFDVTTAATDPGSPTGSAFFFVEFQDSPEYAPDQANLIKSA